MFLFPLLVFFFLLSTFGPQWRPFFIHSSKFGGLRLQRIPHFHNIHSFLSDCAVNSRRVPRGGRCDSERSERASKWPLAEREMSLVGTLSELAGPFVFMAVSQKRAWRSGPPRPLCAFITVTFPKETTSGPPKATSEPSVSVSGIYSLANKMNLSEVLGVAAAAGRRILRWLKWAFTGEGGGWSGDEGVKACFVCVCVCGPCNKSSPEETNAGQFSVCVVYRLERAVAPSGSHW